MKYSSEFSCTSQKSEKKISDREQKKLYAIGWEKSENFNFSLSHRLQTQMSGHSEMLQIVNQFKLKNNNLKLVQQFEKEKRWVEFRSAACWNEVKKTARIFRVAALALNFYHSASVLRTFVWTSCNESLHIFSLNSCWEKSKEKIYLNLSLFTNWRKTL